MIRPMTIAVSEEDMHPAAAGERRVVRAPKGWGIAAAILISLCLWVGLFVLLRSIAH